MVFQPTWQKDIENISKVVYLNIAIRLQLRSLGFNGRRSIILPSIRWRYIVIEYSLRRALETVAAQVTSSKLVQDSDLVGYT